MADMLKDGLAWLETQRQAHLVGSVVYFRGEQSVQLDATVGKTVFETIDDFGLVEKYESRDFIVHAEELDLGSGAVLPEEGDRIKETSGATVYVYEVMAPGEEPSWRYSDPHREALRIHTKCIGTETP